MCQHLKSKVLETRRRDDNPIIYRRRQCDDCSIIFITQEVATNDTAMPLKWQAKSSSPPPRKRKRPAPASTVQPTPQPPAAPWYEQWKRKT